MPDLLRYALKQTLIFHGKLRGTELYCAQWFKIMKQNNNTIVRALFGNEPNIGNITKAANGSMSARLPHGWQPK